MCAAEVDQLRVQLFVRIFRASAVRLGSVKLFYTNSVGSESDDAHRGGAVRGLPEGALVVRGGGGSVAREAAGEARARPRVRDHRRRKWPGPPVRAALCPQRSRARALGHQPHRQRGDRRARAGNLPTEQHRQQRAHR